MKWSIIEYKVDSKNACFAIIPGKIAYKFVQIAIFIKVVEAIKYRISKFCRREVKIAIVRYLVM